MPRPKFSVEVHPKEPVDGPGEALHFEGVDAVSLVDNETHGPPALVAPGRGQDRATLEHGKVLYISTPNVVAFEITKSSD
jgi:hypothetical protein